MLIKTIVEVKNVLRISNLDDDSALPDILTAEEKYIVPVIGSALYADLQGKYDANTLSPTEQLLLDRIQRPLAAFAYHDDLSLQHAMITDAGVRRTTTDNMPAVFQWEFEGVKQGLAVKAYDGIEALYTFLETNAISFPLWTSSESFTRRNRFLIKKGSDFADQYHINHPNRTYNSMLGIMADVEEMYINSSIGKDFFDSLKAQTSPTALEKTVIAGLKKAIAHLCIYHAIEKHSVKVTDKGVTMIQSYEKNTDTGQQAADNLMEMTLKSTYRDGQNYLTKAKNYLNDNASGTVFPLYFASEYYSAPVDPADRVDPNKNMKSFTFLR